MDTKLSGGGFSLDLRGLPSAITGLEELAQRAYIRLVVRRGSFSPDPQLGSDLYKLPHANSSVLEPLAATYVREALAQLPGIALEKISCVCPAGGDHVAVTALLRVDGGQIEMEVAV